jgi:hypothetical protein
MLTNWIANLFQKLSIEERNEIKFFNSKNALDS